MSIRWFIPGLTGTFAQHRKHVVLTKEYVSCGGDSAYHCIRLYILSSRLSISRQEAMVGRFLGRGGDGCRLIIVGLLVLANSYLFLESK
jgi:hypothetical protein